MKPHLSFWQILNMNVGFLMCYWTYIVPALARTMFNTSDATSVGFRDAGLLNGQIGGFYNFIAFIAALAMVPFTRRLGAKPVHAVCLTAVCVLFVEVAPTAER
jgi:maltose/moltooligosaccharide transporter